MDDQSERLGDQVRAAAARRSPLRIVGGDTKAFFGRRTGDETLSLAGHVGVTDYEPSELVITARAGTPLAEIEAALAAHRQMLAFEPPRLGPASTLGGVVAAGFAGPRRPFAGGVRDSVLGVKILDGRGETLRFGGTVFKNVAGFDAFRLQAGTMGRLGVLLEVSIRVAPAPAAEESRSLAIPWPAARELITGLMRRPTPLSGAAHDGTALHLRFSGPAAGVAAAAAAVGGEDTPPTFWDALRHRRLPIFAAPRLWRLSVARTAPLGELPGRWLREWAGGEIWLASEAGAAAIRELAAGAGGHAMLYRGAADGEAVFTPLPEGLMALHQRLAAALDPAGVLNPGRMYEEL